MASSSKVHVKCENCLEKNLERTETEDGFAWVCPRYARAKVKGKGCGVVITEQRYAEMKAEEEQMMRAAQRCAEVRCPPLLHGCLQ